MRTRTTRILAVCAGLMAAAAGPAAAQDLVYQPVNPSFGGDPFNSSHLINLAQQQNDFDDSSFDPPSAQEQFADSLERRILSRTSQEITDRIFGENPQESGEFTVGQQRITFDQTGDGQIDITLLDLQTGAETNLTIPTPQF
ncbi:curli production assembly/transport component CsgF [Limimonas halophila]|uniref:Curli production assembly/transport component CsgF n=1 Tax=Limimonas halophila TaxID=1082479 RepID=A0A1G7S328_9PROT|nr:curli assembly protein CsgF [Limimonas halophila]SDG17364.1 curli production assembly/transport component CsgF [Limimonas halophila]